MMYKEKNGCLRPKNGIVPRHTIIEHDKALFNNSFTINGNSRLIKRLPTVALSLLLNLFKFISNGTKTPKTHNLNRYKIIQIQNNLEVYMRKLN